MWFVQHCLAAQLNAHLVCTMYKFQYYANKCEKYGRMRHTSVPNTSIIERLPLGLYVETRKDVEIFCHRVLLDGLNLR